MKIKDNFPIILENKIKERNITKAELARLIDVSDTTIHRYINGTATPRPLLLNRIIKVLKCSENDFIQK